MSESHKGTRLQYLPHEHEQLKKLLEIKDEQIDTLGELIQHLKVCIQNAPCLVAQPGALTYECAADKPCRVCQWRKSVSEELLEDWHFANGVW